MVGNTYDFFKMSNYILTLCLVTYVMMANSEDCFEFQMTTELKKTKSLTTWPTTILANPYYPSVHTIYKGGLLVCSGHHNEIFYPTCDYYDIATGKYTKFFIQHLTCTVYCPWSWALTIV